MERTTFTFTKIKSVEDKNIHSAIYSADFYASGPKDEMEAVFRAIAALGHRIVNEHGVCVAGTIDELLVTV